MDKNSRCEPENIVRRTWAGRRKYLPTRRSRERPEESPLGAGSAHRLTHVAAIAGMVAILVGAGHLAAWLVGDLSRSGLTAITIKTNASLCLTLVGIALLLLVPAQAASARRWTARMCAAVAFLVGLLTLLENLSGWDFGIDQLLAAETPGAMAVVSPNRMGPPASLSFTLIGLALLILSRRDHRGVRVVQSLALAVCLFSLLATIGFLYGAREFYGIARYTAIAWPAAVSLLLLGLGLLCVRPTEGLMAQVTADDPGGLSLRRLLPTFLLLPLLLGWLRLAGERAGIFDAPTGTAMMMLLFIVIFSALAYHVSRRASRSAGALRESEERLRAVFDNAGVGLVEVARDDRIVAANNRLCEILGYERRELLGKTIHDLTSPEYRATSDVMNARLHKGLIDRIDYEKRYLHRNGSPLWVHVTVSGIHDDQGRWHHSIGTVEDISERKQAEEQQERLLQELEVRAGELQEANDRLAVANEDLAATNEELRATTEELQSEIEDRKRAQEALRESEERFRSVVDSMSEGLMLFDARGNLIYQNAASLRILGFGTQEGGRIEHVDENLAVTWAGWDEKDRPLAFNEWPISRVFLRHERFQDQVLHVRRVETGQEFIASYNGCPIYDADGKFRLGFITIRETTEQVRAQIELAARDRRLRRSSNPTWLARSSGTWTGRSPRPTTNFFRWSATAGRTSFQAAWIGRR